jgi:glycogen(starch) synthase
MSRTLMLVWTGVSTDTRVLREASALVAAGHEVHIIGRSVPPAFVPPPGVTVDSCGLPPSAQTRGRALNPVERLGRWALLPVHVRRRMVAWQAEALVLARRWAASAGRPDAVHAHDFTSLSAGSQLADEWNVPLVYDTHEYWVGRMVEGRPAPFLRRREAREEDRLGAGADAVITVGEGVARALRRDHPQWPEITVVRNTFPEKAEDGFVASPPTAFVYAGRLAADRELEVIAAASEHVDLPIVLRGPADENWLGRFDAQACTVGPPLPLSEVDSELGAAGVALVTLSDGWENHRLALPNKVFHAVSLGVPVVATDVGELAHLVREYGLGVVYRPGDPVDLARACREVVRDHAAYVTRVRTAREELRWSVDAARLVDVYEGQVGTAGSTRLHRSSGRTDRRPANRSVAREPVVRESEDDE